MKTVELLYASGEMETYEVEVLQNSSEKLILRIENRDYVYVKVNGKLQQLEGGAFSRIPSPQFVRAQFKRKTIGAEDSRSNHRVLSPMPGKIIKIWVSPGDKVVSGTPLIVVEAMKMEHTLKSQSEGVVDKILVKVNDLVKMEQELLLWQVNKSK